MCSSATVQVGDKLPGYLSKMPKKKMETVFREMERQTEIESLPDADRWKER